MAVNRNELFNALFDRLSAIPGLVTKSRRLRDFGEVEPSEMPALFLAAGGQTATASKGLPPKWTIRANVYVYVNDPSADGPGAKLQSLIDAVEAALEMQPGEATAPNARFSNAPTQATSLGGLCSKCCIAGTIETDEGSLGDLAVAIIPIEIETLG